MGGTLSPDIMRHWDVEFDFANATFSLFLQQHCEGQVVYWTREPYARVEFDLDRSGHIRVPVTLDGKEISAAIDTGATSSAGSLETIENKFDIDEKNADLKLVPGSDDKHHGYRYPFKTIMFQGITVHNPDLVLNPDDESKSPGKFILGMNVLRHLHLYVAYGERALYITSATAH